MEMHKHKGVTKSHPVTQKHKDKVAQKEHEKLREKKETKKEIENNQSKLFHNESCVKEGCGDIEGISIDEDGFIYINMDEITAEGLRIKVVERDGRNKRTIGIEFRK